MNSVQLSKNTYRWLKLRAEETDQTPDQVAERLLREHLVPKHAYIETIEGYGGPQAVVKGTRIPVSMIIGYLRLGETPESLVKDVLPQLTLAQIYDVLSYFHDHEQEIEQELSQISEEKGRTYLREQLGEDAYLRITGQKI